MSAVAAVGDDARSVLGMGGLDRVLRGKWGLIEGTFTNTTDEPQELLAVAIPADCNGLQYARRVTIPANCRRQCQWPVLVSNRESKTFDFNYMVFTDADGTGPIQRASQEHVVRSFSVVSAEARSFQPTGYRGMLYSGEEDPLALKRAELLADVIRTELGQERLAISIKAPDLDGYPESLECLDQLVVTSNTLHHFPEACDAIRVWIQRGGRAWLMLEQTGIPTIRALLGDTFPVEQIDQTTSNEMLLEVNEDAPVVQFPHRQVLRNFEEPARLARIIAERGKVLWSVDGWPAVIQIPFGDGTVVVTTVSAEVLADVEGHHQTTPCVRRITDLLFRPRQDARRVGEVELSAAAASFIGYEVPSRSVAAVLMLSFVAALAVAGFLLLRKGTTGALLWIVPAAAVLCSLPAVWVGTTSRNVAPPTAVQQQVASMVSGQTTLAADGVVSVFQPEPAKLDVKMKDFSMMTSAGDDSVSRVRRMVWTDRGESEWQNLEQSVGIQNYRLRSVKRLNQPGRVSATLNENGIVGRFEGNDVSNPSDMILAGLSPVRMSVQASEDGAFQATASDLLAPSEFVTGTFLTDTQKRRAAVYQELFRSRGIADAFPDRLTLLFWSDLNQQAIQIGDAATRQTGSTLLTQEVVLQPPAVGAQVTIPPTLLPYRTVSDDIGGFSGAYSNTSRQWYGRENGTVTWLKFDVPLVCEPFAATSGTLSIRLNAGERHVTISMGDRAAPVLLQEFDSPAGLYSKELTADHLREIHKTGAIYLKLDVGDIPVPDTDEPLVEQDDAWKVERMMLTLTGARTE